MVIVIVGNAATAHTVVVIANIYTHGHHVMTQIQGGIPQCQLRF